MDRAKLWTLPDEKPLLIGPAVTPATARAHADWADGLVTVNQSPEILKQVLHEYRDAGGRGQVALQVHVSWAPSAELALQVAREQMAGQVFGPPVAWDLDTPEAFDSLGVHVGDDSLHRSVLVDHDPARLADRVSELVAIGFDAVYLHQAATDPGPATTSTTTPHRRAPRAAPPSTRSSTWPPSTSSPS